MRSSEYITDDIGIFNVNSFLLGQNGDNNTVFSLFITCKFVNTNLVKFDHLFIAVCFLGCDSCVIGLDNDLAQNMRQYIFWTNDDLVQRRIYAAPRWEESIFCMCMKLNIPYLDHIKTAIHIFCNIHAALECPWVRSYVYEGISKDSFLNLYVPVR